MSPSARGAGLTLGSREGTGFAIASEQPSAPRAGVPARPATPARPFPARPRSPSRRHFRFPRRAERAENTPGQRGHGGLPASAGPRRLRRRLGPGLGLSAPMSPGPLPWPRGQAAAPPPRGLSPPMRRGWGRAAPARPRGARPRAEHERSRARPRAPERGPEPAFDLRGHATEPEVWAEAGNARPARGRDARQRTTSPVRPRDRGGESGAGPGVAQEAGARASLPHSGQ
ncbi:uncharacterized protein ACOB8E_002255 [Sarcophilus harrisii]